jgi:hypothetical protein
VQKHFRTGVCITFLLLILTSCSPQLFAQVGFAALTGRITDPNGLPVTGAKVQAVNVDTNVTAATETNDAGLYDISGLPPGNYRILIEKEGFERIVKTAINLHVADIVALNFTLQVGSVSQSVTVTAEAPLVSTTTSSLGGLVDDRQVADLPLNGRNYNDLTLMQPGVAASLQSNSATAIGWTGTEYSSNGASLRSNIYMLDGAVQNNVLSVNGSSATGTTLGVDGILEYRVITSNVTAEYGQAMGSQMTIVSKSGTNQFHGDVFEFLRNSSLDARNFFDLPPSRLGKRLPEFRRNNFGGAAGGPIKKDKTFFFAVYEGLRSTLGTTNTATTLAPGCQLPASAPTTSPIWNGSGIQPAGSVGNCPQLGANPGGPGTNSLAIKPQIIPFVQLYPSPNLPNNQYGFVFEQPTVENYGQIRVDHTLSNKDSFFGRYTIDQASIGIPGNFAQAEIISSSRTQFITLAENHIFSTSLLNSARFSFSRVPIQFDNPVLDPRLLTPPYQISAGLPMGSINPGTVSSIGTNIVAPRVFKDNIFTWSDDLDYTRGKHSLKFGFLLNHYQYEFITHGFDKTTVATGNLANFYNAQIVSLISVEPGGNVTKVYHFNTMGFYAQDAWRITPRLTLNLGLRYEPTTSYIEANGRQTALVNPLTDTSFTHTASPFLNPSLKNWSPRFGFA